MSANLYATSPNWDFCGSRRTVADDVLERITDEIRDDENRYGPLACDALCDTPGLVAMLRDGREDAEFLRRWRAAINDRIEAEAEGELLRGAA